MRHTLLILLIIGMAAGCSSGVTDVGNPTPHADQPSADGISIPSVEDLVGVYQLQADDSPTPCAITAAETPQVTAGASPTAVIVQHFLGFTVASESIATDYDAASGLFGTLDTQDDNVCTGSARFVGTDVQVTLDCQSSADASECASVFVKVP